MKTVVPPKQPCSISRRLGWTTVHLAMLLILLAGCRNENATVRLSFLGDVMPGRGVTLTMDSLKFLKDGLTSADLAMANLESPLTSETAGASTGYNLCTLPENARLLAESGLDLFSVVNNHSLDCGKQGYLDTLAAFDSIGLIAIDQSGYTTHINDLKLTFFAFEDIRQPLDLAEATKSIQAARSNGSLVIVSIHWGMEYQGGASQRQKQLAEQFAAAGATLIWGHHPHVLQPAEWIPAGCAEFRDNTNCSLVLYSLGNALFDQAGLPDTRRSAMVSVVLDQHGIVSIEIKPFLIDTTHSLLTAPDEAASELILSRLKLPAQFNR